MAATFTLKWEKIKMAIKNVNSTFFLVCRTEMLNLCFLHNLGTEKLMSDVYLSSFDLDCIVKSKMAVILHIYF